MSKPMHELHIVDSVSIVRIWLQSAVYFLHLFVSEWICINKSGVSSLQ